MVALNPPRLIIRDKTNSDEVEYITLSNYPVTSSEPISDQPPTMGEDFIPAIKEGTSLTSKLKVWGVAALIAVIGVLLLVYRWKNEKLKAAQYKLEVSAIQAKIDAVENEITTTVLAINEGKTELQSSLPALNSKIEALKNCQEIYSNAATNALNIINTAASRGIPTSDPEDSNC